MTMIVAAHSMMFTMNGTFRSISSVGLSMRVSSRTRWTNRPIPTTANGVVSHRYRVLKNASVRASSVYIR